MTSLRLYINNLEQLKADEFKNEYQQIVDKD